MYTIENVYILRLKMCIFFGHFGQNDQKNQRSRPLFADAVFLMKSHGQRGLRILGSSSSGARTESERASHVQIVTLLVTYLTRALRAREICPEVCSSGKLSTGRHLLMVPVES